MDFLKKFNTHSDYVSFTGTSKFIKPNVSYCKTENEVHFNPIEHHDYSQDYLTFVALENGTFTLTIGSAVTTSILESVSYSLDDGKTWTETNNVDSQTITITTPTVSANEKVLWKGNGVGVSTKTNNSNRPSTSSIFSSSGKFNVEGNIMSLLYGDDFENKDYVADGSSYNFALLFYADKTKVTNVPKLVSAENLVLPIKNVPTCCYYRMFQEYQLDEYTLEKAPSSIGAESIGLSGCTSMFWHCESLITATELQATTLARYCYSYMFEGCTSLTTAPELPATTLTQGCYQGMFNGCTSLTTAPELPATTLAIGCYSAMFSGCTNLTTAPQLLATTLVSGCYNRMFQGCTSLTTAPELPATTLANGCYAFMFSGCTSLTTAPSILPATTLANECYQEMFYGCTNLTTAPELPATTLANWCYSSMFYGCSSLNSITCLATDISASYCTRSWVNGVASSGTFTKAASMTSWMSGGDGIPTGWTVVDA